MYVKWFPVDIPIHEPWVHNRGSSNFLWYLFLFFIVCLFVFCCCCLYFFWPFADERLAVCECGLCCNISNNRVPLSGRFVQVDGFGLCLNSKEGIPYKDPFFFDSDIIFTAKQKSMVAVSSLIIICSITEIILAMAAIRSSNISGQSSQEQQVREVDDYQILDSNKLDTSALSTWITLMISQLVSQLSGQSVNFGQIFSSGQSVINLISHLFNQHVCQHAINKPVADVCLPNCLDDTVYKRYLIIIDLSEGE